MELKDAKVGDRVRLVPELVETYAETIPGFTADTQGTIRIVHDDDGYLPDGGLFDAIWHATFPIEVEWDLVDYSDEQYKDPETGAQWYDSLALDEVEAVEE